MFKGSRGGGGVKEILIIMIVSGLVGFVSFNLSRCISSILNELLLVTGITDQ